MTKSGTFVISQAAADADPRLIAPDDAFTLAEPMSHEAFGFCERGHAYEFLSSGTTSLGGNICSIHIVAQ
jgi:acetyl-CoA acetyltransferase